MSLSLTVHFPEMSQLNVCFYFNGRCRLRLWNPPRVWEYWLLTRALRQLVLLAPRAREWRPTGIITRSRYFHCGELSFNPSCSSIYSWGCWSTLLSPFSLRMPPTGLPAVSSDGSRFGLAWTNPCSRHAKVFVVKLAHKWISTLLTIQCTTSDPGLCANCVSTRKTCCVD